MLVAKNVMRASTGMSKAELLALEQDDVLALRTQLKGGQVQVADR